MQLKRDAFASGSWNIQEEIRRVRAKATEDMLGSSPSMKIDLSEFGHKASQNSLVADRTGVGLRDKMHYSNSLTALKSINASSNLASGPATCLGLAGVVFAFLRTECLVCCFCRQWRNRQPNCQNNFNFQNIKKLTCRKSKTWNLVFCHSVSDTTRDGFRNGALSLNPTISVSEQNQVPFW